MFPVQHTKACKGTWDRTKAQWHCKSFCEDKRSNSSVQDAQSVMSADQGSDHSSEVAIAAHHKQEGPTNDCGCEKASAKVFRKAAEINFSHNENIEKCMEDVIQYLKKRGGQKRRRAYFD